LQEDPIPEGPFGARTVAKPGDTVADNIKGTYPTTEMGQWALEQAEEVYDRYEHGMYVRMGTQLAEARRGPRRASLQKASKPR